MASNGPVEPLAFVFKNGEPCGVRVGGFFWAIGHNRRDQLPERLPWPGFADGLPKKLSLRLFDLWFLASRPRAAGAAPGVLVDELAMLPSWNTHDATGDPVANALAWVRNRGSDSVSLSECAAGTVVTANFEEALVEYEPPAADLEYARALDIAIGRATAEPHQPTLAESDGWPRLLGIDELRAMTDFIGRGRELAVLRDFLLASRTASPAPVLVTGTSGIGKTQLVAAFIRENAARFEHILFVHGSGGDLTAALGRWAPELDGGFPQRGTPIQRAERVRDVLERGGPSLLVLDDVTDARAAMAWLPRRGPCRVVITSQLPLIDGARTIALQPLAPDDAAALITWHLSRGEPLTEHERRSLATICEYLGFSPFALHVAGVHMVASRINPSELLSKIVAGGAGVISVSGTDMAGYPRSVEQVFGLAYDRVAAAMPAPTLQGHALPSVVAWFCGLLAAAPAPRALLMASVVALGLSDVRERDVDAAIGALAARSLVRCSKSELDVHALPGSFFVSRIPRELRPRILEAYVTSLERASAARPADAALLPHVAKAREQLATFEGAPSLLPLEVSLLTWEAATLMQMHGYVAPALDPVFERSAQLSRQMGPNPGLFALDFMRWVRALIEARLDEAQELARRLEELAAALGIPAMQAAALQARGAVLSFKGEHPEAIDALERAIVAADGVPTSRQETRQAQDPRVTCRSDLARSYLMSGRPDSALRLVHEARALGRTHPFSHAFALFSLTMTHQYRREPAEAHEAAQELLAVCGRFGFRQFEWMGRIFLGWSIASLGHYAAGVEVSEMAMVRVIELNAMISRVADATLFAELHLDAGDDDAAQLALERAREAFEGSGEGYFLPERHRLEARLALRRDPGAWAEAERLLLLGRSVAARQRALWHDLRLLTDLGRLRRERGDLSTAGDLAAGLAAVDEGHDLATYGEAAAELAAHAEAASVATPRS
ncbi:MAG: hypothetical protein CVU56_12520 [Deltaproteobacteria bacterium HGW-Deltaproteobacteria-14]|jgi:tetratricopeptide (TPR) repeat protein|nr:MAG: hypothetical protein CVU56_12520 [Deltaproteobacteria bacterium HGW-Deltaproteobacteria-14]